MGLLMIPLPKLGRLAVVEDFLPHVGRNLRVEATPAPVEMRLDEILRRPVASWMAREPFLLVLSTPLTVMLLDATYRMRLPNGAEFEFYLSQTQTAPLPRRLYHAVFN